MFTIILGHTRSWGEGMPELLTKCYEVDGTPTNILGPMDPTKEDVYRVLTQIYREITTVFPDEYVHIGGDEVSSKCW